MHQNCYGRELTDIASIEKGLEWHCERCEEMIFNDLLPTKIKCKYCEDRNGLMRKLKDGTWVHFICINFFPELYPDEAVE